MGVVNNTAYKVQVDVVTTESGLTVEEGTLHVKDSKLKAHLGSAIEEVSIVEADQYVALVTQTSTSAPTATVLEAGLGTIVLARSTTGTYTATLTGAFPAARTVLPANIVSFESGKSIEFVRTSDNVVTIKTYDISTIATPALADGILTASPVTIKVYRA